MTALQPIGFDGSVSGLNVSADTWDPNKRHGLKRLPEIPCVIVNFYCKDHGRHARMAQYGRNTGPTGYPKLWVSTWLKNDKVVMATQVTEVYGTRIHLMYCDKHEPRRPVALAETEIVAHLDSIEMDDNGFGEIRVPV
jgi:hypothetical protein